MKSAHITILLVYAQQLNANRYKDLICLFQLYTSTVLIKKLMYMVPKNCKHAFKVISSNRNRTTFTLPLRAVPTPPSEVDVSWLSCPKGIICNS